MNARGDTHKVETDNAQIADTLEHTADLLQAQGESAFRVRSYRNAAETVRNLKQPITELLRQDGDEVIRRLPGIGEKLAGSIKEIATTGRLGLTERLESEVSPGRLFTEVPGIGEALAQRIHEQLGISTLEELEIAAHDGSLENNVEGIGPDKAEGIRIALSGMLSRSSQRRMRQHASEMDEQQMEPSVALLLDIDQTYRQKAAQGKLRRIAPKRFNPEGEQWLPIMRIEREGWHFTALFSNTARAHQRGKTHDWVVLYYEKNGSEKQCTVITAERGDLKGKRIVRGRESQCRQHYKA
jgi:DNA polymerase (family 10)